MAQGAGVRFNLGAAGLIRPGLATVLVGQGAQAYSQGLALEEVIVTAQKRAQNLQDIPISVTAFSGEALARSNIRSASEYLGLAPNVSYTEDGQTGARGIGISVRSVGTMVSGENAFINTIGVYVDEFSVVSVPNQVANPELPDMERIEILHGLDEPLLGRQDMRRFEAELPNDLWQSDCLHGPVVIVDA